MDRSRSGRGPTPPGQAGARSVQGARRGRGPAGREPSGAREVSAPPGRILDLTPGPAGGPAGLGPGRGTTAGCEAWVCRLRPHTNSAILPPSPLPRQTNDSERQTPLGFMGGGNPAPRASDVAAGEPRRPKASRWSRGWRPALERRPGPERTGFQVPFARLRNYKEMTRQTRRLLSTRH